MFESSNSNNNRQLKQIYPHFHYNMLEINTIKKIKEKDKNYLSANTTRRRFFTFNAPIGEFMQREKKKRLGKKGETVSEKTM